MVIHSNRRPQESHIGRYSGPSSSDVASIIPYTEHVQVGRRYILLKGLGTLNSNFNKVFGTVSVSLRSYDSLRYVILLPNGTYEWYRELT